ncbi:MAG: DUF4126 family protein [Candidatus Dadabacteria bacterium]|nr:DUF4126 family protein [Candidatus Dadabacteria bacterium]
MDGVYFVAAILVGISAGLRTMTAPAVASLAARYWGLGLWGTQLGFMSSQLAAIVLSIFAVLEYIYDLLPFAGNRIDPGPLLARIFTGALSGACVAVGAAESITAGAVAGGLGAVAGAYGGYPARKAAIRAVGRVPAALGEDIVAIGLAVLAVRMVV